MLHMLSHFHHSFLFVSDTEYPKSLWLRMLPEDRYLNNEHENV